LFVAQLTRFPFQIDVAVNAPEAGTIKEFLANEEDTVTVGQDLVRLELGGEGGGGKEKTEATPKEPASKDQPTSSDPEPKKESPEPKEESSPPQKSEPKKPSPPKQEPKKEESKSSSSAPTLGNREERRVRCMWPLQI
jgi:2-oxoglutarate dehydrogenase E2 component (dihydrolipoamide succinyltransferase)